MRDIQNEPDLRRIDIDQVGIRNIAYPITVKDKLKGSQRTVASISMSVNLPHGFKGTHMSRFVEVLDKHKENIHIDTVKDILSDMRAVLNAERSHIEMSFTYFIEKAAPVSKLKALMDYNCTYSGTLSGASESPVLDSVMTVRVPVLSLCPCSKEISRYGAHNQRGIITISVRVNRLVWIEELVDYAERSASSPVYPLLKREDEKYVTERSYENPVFAEDIVRNVTGFLNADARIVWFEAAAENFESIHNHNAWALISRRREG
ncbi:MAG: GTP cyclohydrolase FolE2 [Deferribacteraceae bacterium]|nr:GTP cyclohydrolase FolE2 [Deferribacteraceae bacterium]